MGHDTSYEQQERRTNDVGPHRVSELYVLGNAANGWIGPCHLQYDTYALAYASSHRHAT